MMTPLTDSPRAVRRRGAAGTWLGLGLGLGLGLELGVGVGVAWCSSHLNISYIGQAESSTSALSSHLLRVKVRARALILAPLEF